MIKLALAFLIALAAPAALAQDGDYLTDEAMFAAAWDALRTRIGADARYLEIAVSPTEIAAAVQAPQGGPRVDRWRIRHVRGWFGAHDTVAGPEPMPTTGPVSDVVSGFFSLKEVPVGRLHHVIAEALDRAQLMDAARASTVRIGRQVGLVPRPHYGEVRWHVAVASARETVSAQADADGRIIGLDISGTHRGRNRDFLAQADWPFETAAAGFARLVGAGTEVFEVDVSRLSLAVEAATPGRPDLLTTYSWDGGMFTKSFLDLPNIALKLPNGDLPFALADVDLTAIPEIIAIARAQAPRPDWSVISMTAARQRGSVGPAEVLWRIRLSERPGLMFTSGEEETVVQIRPDGTLVSVLLPKALREVVRYVDGAGFAAAMDIFTAELGPSTLVFEMMIRADRITVALSDPARPGEIARVDLSDRGLRVASAMPMMMETDADRFTLASLAALDPARIEAIKAKAVEALEIPGGEAWRLRIWSGAPFWRAPAGEPLIDVRVGIPPTHNVGGYAVLRLDGTLVEAIK